MTSTQGCAAGLHVVVMGVSGSGKTSVATALAEHLGFAMIEADEYHPQANVDKMAAGIPLTDADRAPWLRDLAEVLGGYHDRGEGTVLACSALRRRYRDVLRSRIPPTESLMIVLEVAAETLRERMARREGHYMPVSLLESQLATLEPLGPDEGGATVDANGPLEGVINQALAAVRAA
jgi:gluconokinase